MYADHDIDSSATGSPFTASAVRVFASRYIHQGTKPNVGHKGKTPFPTLQYMRSVDKKLTTRYIHQGTKRIVGQQEKHYCTPKARFECSPRAKFIKAQNRT
jgi:hypothetical protein